MPRHSREKSRAILIDGGYVTFSGTAPYYHYYLKDHLGSNRVVVSPAGTAEQINYYYPFGGLFGESTSSSTQRFKFNGKEFDRTHGVDWYDYGARHMSPDAGRFTTIDPMAEKYYNTSPYAYCANNPVNAIDEYGNLTIFINGFYLWGEGGNSSYWYNSKTKSSFDNAINSHFGEKRKSLYYDGSLGGIAGLYSEMGNPSVQRSFTNINPTTRYSYGYYDGKKDAEKIISMLTREEDGVIEPIRIITHSMGGAYAKGFVKALVDYIRTHPEGLNGLKITEYDFAPYQPERQKAINGVTTFQYSHVHDPWADYLPIRGALQMKTSSNEDMKHSLFDFWGYIWSLPEGQYEFQDGIFVKK